MAVEGGRLPLGDGERPEELSNFPVFFCSSRGKALPV